MAGRKLAAAKNRCFIIGEATYQTATWCKLTISGINRHNYAQGRSMQNFNSLAPAHYLWKRLRPNCLIPCYLTLPCTAQEGVYDSPDQVKLLKQVVYYNL